MPKLDYDIHNFCIVCHIVYLKPQVKCVDINGCGKKIRTKPRLTRYKRLTENTYISN